MNGAAPGVAKQKPAIEAPTQPFINLSGDGPVDPTKFQCFVLPQEFIEKANAVELPRVKPDDFNDSEPPHTPTPASPGSAIDNRTPPTNLKRAKSDAATQPEIKPQHRPESEDTVMIHRRRKSAPIAREVLEAAAHPQSEAKPSWRNWGLWGLVGVVVLLIWFLSREKDGGEGETSVGTESSAAAPVAPRVIGDVPSVPAVASATSAAPAEVAQAPIASEALPEVVDIDSPDATKTKPVQSRVTTAPKAMSERTPRNNPRVAVPAPSVSATIKGVIPVIEPE